jgi:hypothetical protein
MDLTGIKAAYDGLKFVKDVFESHVDDIAHEKSKGMVQEANSKIIAAQQAIFDLQNTLLELQQENVALKHELEKRESIGERLTEYELVKYEGGAVVYKYKGEPEHLACPACIESKGEIHIIQDSDDFYGKFRCPSCGISYKIHKDKQIKL